MKEKISERTAFYREQLTKFLQDFVRTPSVFGSEKAAIERCASEMQRLGYDDVRIDRMGNLTGRIGSGSKIVAFDGHCDTVGVGNPANWTDDPFSGILRDGKIYGRGSCDQKSGVASSMYAARIAADIGLPDDTAVCVIVSILEEKCEGINLRHIIEEENIRPELFVLTEPSNCEICIGHKGRMDLDVMIEGTSAHGSTPDLGDNAVYAMTPLVLAIEKMHTELPDVPPLGRGTIAVTGFSSETPARNAVPDKAHIMIDRRLTTGETAEGAIETIRNLPCLRGKKVTIDIPEFDLTTYTGWTERVKLAFPPWTMQKSHPAVQAAVKAFEEQFSAPPVVRTWSFSTNGVIPKGVYDIPTIGFGPGDEKLAHMPDEYVPTDHLVKAAEFYTSLLYAL